MTSASARSRSSSAEGPQPVQAVSWQSVGRYQDIRFERSDEGIARKVGSVRIAPINRHAGGAGEITARPAAAFDHAFDDTGHAPFGSQDAPPR